MIKVISFNEGNDVFKEAFSFYLTKIKKFCAIDFIYIEELAYKDLKKSIVDNSSLLLEKLKKYKISQIYLFELAGKQLDSKQFSQIIFKHVVEMAEDICFVIGPSDGFSTQIKAKYANQISFGKITYPHLLFRTIVLEQIYRSFKIINNQKYHK